MGCGSSQPKSAEAKTMKHVEEDVALKRVNNGRESTFTPGSAAAQTDDSSPNKSKLQETQQTFFELDEAVHEVFLNRLEDVVPSHFFERLWTTDPSDQHLTDMFLIVRMSQYFEKTEDFFEMLKEECMKEKAKQLGSSNRPDFVKYRKEYEDAEDLFDREGLDKHEKKGIKLEDISKDPIGDNPSKFIKRRCDDAYHMVHEFETYLKGEADKYFKQYNPEIFANSKTFNRAQEKVLEMKEDPKYKAPVENSLYDLLRAQICLKPEHLSDEAAPNTIDAIGNFIQSLIDQGLFIRVKNKLVSLGQLLLNFVYKNQIVEVQIVFATSLKALKQSHTVYDLDRLKDMDAVHTYLAKKRPVRHFAKLFKELQLNAYGENINTAGVLPGSFITLFFVAYALSNHDAKSFPVYPKNSKKKYKNFTKGVGRMIDDKGNMIMKKGKMINDDRSVYEGEWKNFMSNGKGKMTYADGSIYEGEWKNDERAGQGKLTYANKDVYEGEFNQNLEDGQGKKTFANGEIFEGTFSKGRQHGFGKLHKKDGTVADGEWKNGLKVENAMTAAQIAQQQDPKYWSQQGDKLYEEKKYIECEEVMRKAVSLEPSNPFHYNTLANSLYFQERYADAEKNYRKCCELNPNSHMYINNMAFAIDKLKRYDEAEEAIKKAISMEDKKPLYWSHLADVLVCLNKFAEAEDACLKAINLNNGNSYYYSVLANTRFQLKKYTLSEEAIRKALSINGSQAHYYNTLADALYYQDKYADAEAQYKKAISMKADNSLWHNNLGFALEKQKKYKEAAESIKKALSLEPSKVSYQSHLDDVNKAMGQA